MKLSLRTSQDSRRAFTLVELLVVIAVLAILMGLLFPVISAVMERSRRLQARNDELQIISSINAYYTDYQKYPVDPAAKPGDAVYSTDNNKLFDVLRNITGTSPGNSLNSRGVFYLTGVSFVQDGNHPRNGIQASTGVWYDPWGSPYNVAVDGNYDNQLNSPSPLPNFYSDVGPLQLGVIAWSFGKNGQLGGGPAATSFFGSEGGTPGKLSGSGDVVSWK